MDGKVKAAAMLFAFALSNVWAAAGAAGVTGSIPETGQTEGDGAGPPPGGPSGEIGGAVSSRTVITFPFSGGSDTSFRISAPVPARVLKASLELEGRSALPPPSDRRTNPSGAGNRAYEGATKEASPKSPPSSFQSQVIPQAACADLSYEDGVGYTTITYGPGSPYQLFRFKITEASVSGLRVRWVGTGFDLLLDWTEASVYIYRSGSWECVGSVEYEGADFEYHSVSRAIQAGAQGCVDSEGMVNILVMGPFGLIYCGVETELVELTVTGSSPVWPTDLSLDIGADGIVEYQMAGELRGTVVIGDDFLRPPAQALIDSFAGSGMVAEVVLCMASKTGGVVAVNRAEFDFDRPPEFRPVPPGAVCFEEDTDAPALLDLDDYATDDRDKRLGYELVVSPQDGRITAELGADGHTLDFRSPYLNWFGTREFAVRATDSSGLTAVLFFNATVLPVNDPPTVSDIRDQIAPEDLQFSLAVRAHDVDDPSYNLSFSDDSPLFDIDPVSGAIVFTPTNEQVGRYLVTISVEDTKGASSSTSFNLTVENRNDPPELECPERLEALEDELFEYRIVAEDIDAGDSLSYSVESDIEGLSADPATGELSFFFENSHVGEHILKFSVSDSAGELATRPCLLVVQNVNDPPVVEDGRELTVKQGEEVEYVLEAYDVDPGDSLTFSTTSRLVELDPSTGVLRWVPGNEDVGIHRVRVLVHDREGAEASGTLTIVVENVNDPPVSVTIMAPVNESRFMEGDRITFIGSAVDPDAGDVLTYTWREGGTVLGRGASMEVRLGPGKHLIVLEVSDGELAATASVTVTVERASNSGGLRDVLSGFWPTLLFAAAGSVLAVCAAALAVRRKRRGGAGKGVSQHPAHSRDSLPSPPSAESSGAPRANEAGADMPPPSATSPSHLPQDPALRPLHSLSPSTGPATALPTSPTQANDVHLIQSPVAPPVTSPCAYPPFPPAASASPTVPFHPGSAAGGRLGEVNALQPASAGSYPLIANGGSGYSAGGRESGRDPPEAEPVPEPAPDGEDGEGIPVGFFRNLRPLEDGAVTKDAMRAAILDAREAIRAGKAAGLELRECERLLAEAMAASYRMDYNRARNLAKKAEAVALSLLERISAGE
ncbi:MAG: putative Ig domain-containing protein [Thermoplasmata archaeon]